MDIDKMIEQWEEKHSSILAEYSKGNANNEVMQMYRSQMKNVLDLINQLKQVKNCFIPVVTNRTFSVNEVKILLEKQKQACANEFIHAEMTMEQAKRRVLNAPTVSF